VKYLTLALCVLGLYACSPRVPSVTAPERIDWSVVPVEAAHTDTKPTANEEAFKRERRRAYVALQFERAK
jgi:hypothetical protein